MDRNGRDRGDPWSLRQCGIYQQICLTTRRSSWIMLQISESIRAHINQILQRGSHENECSSIDPMIFHVVFISAMAANWQEYLEHLQSQIAILVSICNRRRYDAYASLFFFFNRTKRPASQRWDQILITRSLSTYGTAKTFNFFVRNFLERRRSSISAWTLLRVVH